MSSRNSLNFEAREKSYVRVDQSRSNVTSDRPLFTWFTDSVIGSFKKLQNLHSHVKTILLEIKSHFRNLTGDVIATSLAQWI
jgi:hypothetical protein